ncbi:MAG: hypothetical protein WC916_07800 [Candidatus Woesearchaeota archaeon]
MVDSIEKMRRLNELTKELKQHGFAESSFEAIQQANQIYGDDEMTSDVSQGMIRSSTHERLEAKNAEATVTPAEHPKIKELTNNLDTLTKKMNEIVAAINDIDVRLKDLKNRPAVVERVVERTREPERTPVHEEQQATTAPYTEKQTADKKKEDYSNQRTGNYAPDDISIDKVFYYGKK